MEVITMAVAPELARCKMTKQEFKQLPEGPPYYEFEYGEVVEVSRAKPKHNTLKGLLFATLDAFICKRGLGIVFPCSEVDLTADLTYAPDITFIRQQRASIYDEENDEIVGVPDLVVEIYSTHRSRDRVKKFNEYLKVGVEWYWLIDPVELTVEEYHLANGHYVCASSVAAGEVFRPGVFEGLEIDLQTMMSA
jgi:Uma2 family endonuclease